MSITGRLRLRDKTAASERARLAYEKAIAEQRTAHEQASAERQARMDAYDSQQLQEWDLERVNDELAAARAKVLAAALDTPVYRAIVEEMDLRNRLMLQGAHLKISANRLGLPVPELGHFGQPIHNLDPARLVELAIGEELARRSRARTTAEQAAREAYIEDERDE